MKLDNLFYAIIVESKEAKSTNGTTLTKSGDKFWVVEEYEGWVEATSTRISKIGVDPIPLDIKKFSSYEQAEKFVKKWKGHPWYCNPNGNYEIFPITPRYKSHIRIDGYDLVIPSSAPEKTKPIVDKSTLLARLLRLQVGGCTCVTKTPDIEYHSIYCTYRVASETHAELLRLYRKSNETN